MDTDPISVHRLYDIKPRLIYFFSFAGEKNYGNEFGEGKDEYCFFEVELNERDLLIDVWSRNDVLGFRFQKFNLVACLVPLLRFCVDVCSGYDPLDSVKETTDVISLSWRSPP